ncbi:MAG: histidine ammonia-lyase [Paraglaciecola sp.]|jgi:histidine ammonia-lyase
MGVVFKYGIDHLTVKIASELASGNMKGEIGDAARAKIDRSSKQVDQIVAADEIVYGINTGFGPLCTTVIDASQASRLQENILKSHAVGVGEKLSKRLTRLMLVTKLHALAQGYSGVRYETMVRILFHLDKDVLPVVPEQGSVGASGDLAPLSHLFLPLIGLGNVMVQDKVVSANSVLSGYGMAPLRLSPKEGLALINGTQFILAHAVEVVARTKQLLDQEDLISAMMLEGCLASVRPFDERLHQVRPFVGSSHVAARIRHMLSGSEVLHSHAACARVQDPYSLRCIPQVHGASREAWLHLHRAVEIELNAVTDNPLLFVNGDAISGGNFHGQLLALPLDYMALGVSEIGNIADRRIYLSLEGDTPGVPKLLLKETGINSGFMILQYTTAALASENKGLCFPASADSIPTSLGQEDHVSMGSISGRKALQIIGNVERIQSIELICAAQALDFHHPLKSGAIVSHLHDFVRSYIPHVTEDILFTEMMEQSHTLIRTGSLLKESEKIEKITTNWSPVFDGE